MILFKGKTNDLETLFPPTLKLDGQICVRNGISARSKFMIGIYDIALYLGEMTEDAETAITSRYAKQLRMICVDARSNRLFTVFYRLTFICRLF